MAAPQPFPRQPPAESKGRHPGPEWVLVHPRSPASLTPQGNSHLFTPSTPLLLLPSLHGLLQSCPTLCHTVPTSPPRTNDPHLQPALPHSLLAGPGIPDTAPSAAPQTQAEREGPPHVVATAYVVQDPQVPSLSLCLTSSAQDMNHHTRQLRLLKYIFYRIPRTRHGGLAVFVCSTLRFLHHPDVLYLQLVAHLTWQADVGLQVPELASGQKKPCVTQNFGGRGVLLLGHSRIHV